MSLKPRASGLTVAAAAVAVAGLLASCTTAKTPAAPQTLTPSGSVSASATVSATPSTEATVAQTAEQADPTVTSIGPTAQLQVDYAKGQAPTSTTRGGRVNVDGYLLTVWQGYQSVWRKVYAKEGPTSMPSMTFDITSGSDRYVSSCKDAAGNPIVITPSSPAMFYCVDDGQRGAGAVALPAITLGAVWQKAPSAKVADLAVAIATTRQAGLILTTSLPNMNLPTMFPSVNLHYSSLCLAGAWAHGVYQQNAFTDMELGSALELGLNIPSQSGTDVSSVTARDERAMAAWLIAFRSGAAGECVAKFQQ